MNYRNKGNNVCWVPGTDHAGIATQSKVAKELEKEGINKDNLTREEFINKIYVNFSRNSDRFGDRTKSLQIISPNLLVMNQKFTPRTISV